MYAGVAVSVAARLYGNEAVLFSDVGSYKTLLLRRYFRPRARPTLEEALLLLALVFPINFYWQSWMIDLDSTGARFKWVLAVAQVAILAGPAVLLAWYRKLDLRETFSLRVPSPVQLSGAVLVAVAAAPMSLLIYRIQVRVFGAPGSLEMLEQLDVQLAAGSAFTAFIFFALLPGVCEEALFRGLLQSGVRDKFGVIGTAALVGVLFGMFHMALVRLPVTTAMGILLTFICLRSGSIFPAMLIHVANNAVPVLAQRVELLRDFYGPSLVGEATLAATFDGRMIAFIAAFVAGLALIVYGRAANRRIG